MIINVSEINNNTFSVKVISDTSSTKYVIKLTADYYLNLTKCNISKKELMSKSFEFLLKQEPKESILPKFNLKSISTYFPKYPLEIKNYF